MVWFSFLSQSKQTLESDLEQPAHSNLEQTSPNDWKWVKRGAIATATLAGVGATLYYGGPILFAGFSALMTGIGARFGQNSSGNGLATSQLNNLQMNSLIGVSPGLSEVQLNLRLDPVNTGLEQPEWLEELFDELPDDLLESYGFDGVDETPEETDDPLEGVSDLFQEAEPTEGQTVPDVVTQQELTVVRETRVGIPPVLVNNTLGEFVPGERRVFTSSNFAVTDSDTPDSDINLRFYDVQGGQLTDDGTPVPSGTDVYMTQAEVTAGMLGLEQDNTNTAPTLSWEATDDLGNTIGPFRPAGIFRGYGFIGEPFPVSQYYPQSTTAFSAAVSSDMNRIMTVWSRLNSDQDAFGQLLDVNGTRIYGDEIAISGESGYSEYETQVVARNNNNFLVTHLRSLSLMRGEYYNAEAIGDGSKFTMATDVDCYAVGVFSDDGFRAGYINTGGSPDYYSEVKTQSFYPNATVRGNALVHDGLIQWGVYYPKMLRLPEDKHLLIWSRKADGHYGSIIRHGDTTSVGPVRLTTTSDEDYIQAAATYYDGVVSIIYRDEVTDYNWEVRWERFFESNLTGFGSPKVLDAYYEIHGGIGQKPSTAYLGQGISVASWVHAGDGYNNMTVFIQPYRSQGTLYGERLQFDTRSIRYAEGASVVGLGDGRGTIFYEEKHGDNYGYDGRLIGPTVAPTVTAYQMTVSQGERIPVNVTMIHATDPDTQSSRLTVRPTVVGGQFERASDRGTPITEFTVADIEAGSIEFVQSGGTPRVTLQVTDGVLRTANIPMDIEYDGPSFVSSSVISSVPDSSEQPVSGSTSNPVPSSDPVSSEPFTSNNPSGSDSGIISISPSEPSTSDLPISTKSSDDVPGGTNMLAIVLPIVCVVLIGSGGGVAAFLYWRHRRNREANCDYDIELRDPSQIGPLGVTQPLSNGVQTHPGYAQTAPAMLQTVITPAGEEVEIPDSVPLIYYEDLEIDQETGYLGGGSFGKVWKAQWKLKSNEPVAVKFLNPDIMAIEGFASNFMREAKTLGRLRFSYVVEFLGVCPEPLAIVTEYAGEGSLDEHLKKKALDWPRRLLYGLDGGRGLEYLHRQGVLHRDIKSANLLIGQAVIGGQLTQVAKWADFGESKKTAVDGVERKHTKGLGTPSYQSPEVMGSEEYSERADIYSFAVVLWELLTQEAPYEDMTRYQTPWDIINAVRAGKRLEIPAAPTPGGVELERNIQPKMPKGYAELITFGWMQKPIDRPTAEQMRQRLETMVKQTPQYRDPRTFSQTLPPTQRV